MNLINWNSLTLFSGQNGTKSRHIFENFDKVFLSIRDAIMLALVQKNVLFHTFCIFVYISLGIASVFLQKFYKEMGKDR